MELPVLGIAYSGVAAGLGLILLAKGTRTTLRMTEIAALPRARSVAQRTPTWTLRDMPALKLLKLGGKPELFQFSSLINIGRNLLSSVMNLS